MMSNHKLSPKSLKAEESFPFTSMEFQFVLMCYMKVYLKLKMPFLWNGRKR